MSETLMEKQAEPEQAAPEAEGAAPEAATPSEPERPEWLPEKFKTPADMAAAYSELEKWKGSKEEDIRKAVEEEFTQKRFENRPERPGDYQLPETIDAEAAVDNELLTWWSSHAHENGYSQEQFQQGIEMYAKAIGTGPDLDAERQKLGDSANDRIQAASIFASSFFPKETMPAIERLFESSEGVVAMEAVMSAMKDGKFGDSANVDGKVTEATVREMMNDPRYHSSIKRDPAYVKQVDDMWKQLYGNG
jgi:hypothetical protein